ncbi:MAG: hypothetical protein JWN06_2528 [Propionibacteriaceae bacterium]|jgi:hypothetical protein|nr:hypothetical protein [Propionibacteriaceae bacterium]
MAIAIRTLALALASLAMLTSTALGPVPAAANSAPPLLPAGSAPSRVTLSATQWRAAGYVTKARNYAVSAKGSTMNYTKMKKVFGTKNSLLVDWRRQMAAGFRQAGGRITHISKAEKKKIEAKRKKVYGKRKPLAGAAVSGMVSPTSSPCLGRSGKAIVNRNETHKYYNSCETKDLEYYWGGCVLAMAFIGKFTEKAKKIDLPRYLIGSFCGFEAAQIKRAADRSSTGSIYLRTYREEAYMPYPSQVRYSITYTLIPQ